MDKKLLNDDYIDLAYMRDSIKGLQRHANRISDEYSLMSDTSLQIAKIGERLNPVLVALDDVLKTD